MGLQYADDDTMAAHSDEDLQGILNAFTNYKGSKVIPLPTTTQPSITKVANGVLLSVDPRLQTQTSEVNNLLVNRSGEASSSHI